MLGSWGEFGGRDGEGREDSWELSSIGWDGLVLLREAGWVD